MHTWRIKLFLELFKSIRNTNEDNLWQVIVSVTKNFWRFLQVLNQWEYQLRVKRRIVICALITLLCYLLCKEHDCLFIVHPDDRGIYIYMVNWVNPIGSSVEKFILRFHQFFLQWWSHFVTAFIAFCLGATTIGTGTVRTFRVLY